PPYSLCRDAHATTAGDLADAPRRLLAYPGGGVGAPLRAGRPELGRAGDDPAAAGARARLAHPGDGKGAASVMTIYEWTRDGFTVGTDPARLYVDAIHAYLTTSYWAEGISRELVARSLPCSLCFGLYEGERQIGLARVITDRATYAYLCDVYVLPERRGRGLGHWLMECVMEHPDLQGLRRF